MKKFYNLITAIFLMVALSMIVSPAVAGDGDEAVPFLYQRPVDCVVTGTYYEDYRGPSDGFEPRHTGKDFGCETGTSVQASGSGQVVLVRENWMDYPGTEIFILHGYDPETGLPFLTFYGHLQEAKVEEGDWVDFAQEIGTSGTAGTGAHLHWGAANQMPSDFASYYEHARDMADGRGWLDPDNAPEMLIPPERVSEEEDSSSPRVSDEVFINYVGDKLPCESMAAGEGDGVIYQGVVIHHTAGGGWNASVMSHCGENRPPYLFVIESDGEVFQLGAFGSVTYHALEPNNSTYASIALEGDLTQVEPTLAQLDSLIATIVWLQDQGMGSEILGHRDVNDTECPGDTLYSLLPEIRRRVENGEVAAVAAVASEEMSAANSSGDSTPQGEQSEGETEDNREVIRGFEIWLEANEEVSQTLDFADKLGIINKQDVVNAVPWILGGITLFLLLVGYLVIHRLFGRKAKFVRVRQGRGFVIVPVARRFYNRLFWLGVIALGVVHFSQTDYVTRKVTGQFWWILLAITVFFWFLKEAEKSRVRWGRMPSSAVWIRDIILSGALLVLAGWMYGNLVGMSFYVLAKNQTVETQSSPMSEWVPEKITPSSFGEGMTPIPSEFIARVRTYGPRVIQIAREENVPPESLFTIWLKESGGRMVNPGNGEGLCGFYSLTRSGQESFPPGSITEEELYRQMRICATEFARHAARVEKSVSFTTTDFEILAPIYMAYNGNIDCHGNSYPSWRDHPYVMNGLDASHQGMVARDGNGGCIALSVIGAMPAHIQIGQILREIDPSLP